MGLFKKRIKIVYQNTDYECGLCCINMVATYYGYERPMKFYRELFNVGRDGIDLIGIGNIFKEISLNPTFRMINDSACFEFENYRPYIAHTKKQHYLVIQRVNKQIHVIDPAEGGGTFSKKELFDTIDGYLVEVCPSDTFSPLKNKTSDFRHILPVLKEERTVLFKLTGITYSSYFLSLKIPLLLQSVIDEYVYGRSFDGASISDSIVVLTCFIVIYYIVSTINNKMMTSFHRRVHKRITEQTIMHLLNVKPSFFEVRSQGDILFKINTISQVHSFVVSGTLQILGAVSFVLMITIVFGLKFYNIFLILIAIFCCVVAMVLYYDNKMRIFKRKEYKSKRKVDLMLTEYAANIFQIKSLNATERLLSSFQKRYTEYLSNFEGSQRETYKANLNLTVLFNYAPVYVIALMMSLPNIYSYSIGDIFLIYSLLCMFFTQCLSLVSQIINLQLMRTNLFYYNDLMDEPIVKKRKGLLIDRIESICLEHIEFSYSDISGNLINNLFMKIEKGQKIAIVGVSGSGKTTIAKILSGIYEPKKGDIKINGIHVENIDKETLYKKVYILSQEPFIFEGSIHQNITMGSDNCSDEEVTDALQKAMVYEDVCSMPLRQNTLISGKGRTLSAGQLQRLAIARIFLKKPQLIILDEATNAIDVKTERIIFKNIKKEGITHVVITHRITSVIDADCIYCMSNGTIVEVGKHDNLFNKKGYYYDLLRKENGCSAEESVRI